MSRGNVLDMTVGMIVGSAFTAIITALVNKVLMPALGMLTGGIDFKDLKIILKEAVLNAEDPTIIDVPEVAIAYGEFIAAIINFFLIAISVFILIKVIGSFKRKKVEEPAPVEEPKPDPQIELLTEIRDLLKGEKATEEEKEAETV
ncbi:MAG: large-conductance mechanosensitive channel protein MscL [Ruminiclostridium sp.]|nr:large-conductance mechanosensitive channel protein MscL [Ruminiclostridium sp.]